MNSRTAALAVIAAFAPSLSATPIYDLWNLYREATVVSLEGWGLKIERLSGFGVGELSVDDPGGSQLLVNPTSRQIHLMAQLSGAGGSAAGIYTLNLMYDGSSSSNGGSSLAAGFSPDGPHVLGTLTTPGGTVYHAVAAGGDGPSITLGYGASGGLEVHGTMQFCSDASCSALVPDAIGTLAFGAACAADADCRIAGQPGEGASTQIYQLALPPEALDASTTATPEVPEPGTYLLVGFGLVALSLLRRRQA